MTRDGEMRARDYLRLVLGNVERETKVSTVQSLLGQATAAVYFYGDPANRPSGGPILAQLSHRGLERAEHGSDHQLAWARAFIASARSDEDLATVRGLLDGEVSFEGLAVDTELRWHIVRSLASAGAADDDVITEELRRDPTDRGARHAASATASRPTPEAKEAAWRLIVEDLSQPLALVDEVMAGFMPHSQEAILAPYRERFFEALPQVWRTKDLPDALAFGRRMYPHLIVEHPTVEQTDEYLRGTDVPSPVRRLLLEGRDGILRALTTRAVDAAVER